MKLTSVNYSLSSWPSSLAEWKEQFTEELRQYIASGSDIIVYPELFFMGAGDDISTVADFVWDEFLPELIESLGNHQSLIVLGTAPRKSGGLIFNSSPILRGKELLHQDKLNLTPWETAFTPGDELKIFSFRNLRTSVIICFDIEQPSLAVTLKKSQVHLVLVPSATADANGSARVNRCASGRAVELGAAVLTSLLVGDSTNELVDHSEGLQGLYLPAQEVVTIPQESVTAYSTSQKVVGHYQLSKEMLESVKNKTTETKPYLNTERSYQVKEMMS